VTPAARLQAAVEILDEVIAAARGDGAPADVIVTRYFKARRYAGSKDRRAVRELVFRAIRRSAEIPASGRAAVLGLADEEPGLRELFGEPRGPEALAGIVPAWLVPEVSPLVAPAEWPALLERAPLDVRVNAARANREELLSEFPGAQPTAISPWGLRLPADSGVDDHPAFAGGLVEVQDEGSQLIALACDAGGAVRVLDLCAGAGGKALAIAAAWPNAEILATDTNRARLAKLPPPAYRCGCSTVAGRRRGWPTWPAASTSCSSMRPAPAVGLGAATRRDAGALRRSASTASSRFRSGFWSSARPWSGPAAAWFMRSARCSIAKGQGRSPRSSIAVHPGLHREHLSRPDVRMVPAGC
jgi:16S rRNA (cytosine967-C5)-methyltransferase